MIYDPCYIVSDNTLKSLLADVKDKRILVSISQTSTEYFLQLYHLLSDLHPTNRFSFFIATNQENATGWSKEMVPFFFFRNYIKISGFPQVAFSNPEKMELLINTINETASGQGFPQIEMLDMGSKANNTASIFNSSDLEKIREAYRTLLGQPDYSENQTVYINLLEKEDIDIIERFIIEDEQTYKIENNSSFLLMEQNKKLREQIHQLRLVNGAAGEEIQTLQSHINILKSGSQAKQLQNYYNNEYETLPKWYKQFGHLLKVIIGKRSFKSLFSDKVKKYKD